MKSYVSAMLLSSTDKEELEWENESNTNNMKECEQLNLEKVAEKEGLQYVGGYIVKKFPQYQDLGEVVASGDKSWIGVVSRAEGKLFKPN